MCYISGQYFRETVHLETLIFNIFGITLVQMYSYSFGHKTNILNSSYW